MGHTSTLKHAHVSYGTGEWLTSESSCCCCLSKGTLESLCHDWSQDDRISGAAAPPPQWQCTEN